MNGIKEKISSDMINVIDFYQKSRLFKDSQLINPYNVVAFVKGEKYFKD